MERLNISNEEDRLAVARILLKNDYTVRQSKENVGSKTKKYLEYKENKK